MKTKIKILKMLSVFIFVVSIFMLGESVNLKAGEYDSSKTYKYIMDVDNPLTLAEIIEVIGLEASVGGNDLSNYIVNVDDDGYLMQVLNRAQSFMRNLGEYTLCYEVISPQGVSSTCEVIIDVRDITPPSLLEEYSKLSYSFLKSDIDSKKAYEIIDRALYTVDNFDLFNVNKEIREIDLNNKNEKGNYDVEVILSDYSGNEKRIIIDVEIIDYTGIRFYMDNSYSIIDKALDMKCEMLIETQNIKAYDYKGNELEVTIANPHLQDLTEEGIHTVEFKAVGENGEIEYSQHIVLVIDRQKPVFTLDESVLIVYDNKLYSDNQFENIIKLRVGSSRDFNYEVINDEYTENYSKPGMYNYEVEITYLNDDGSESDEKDRINLTMKVMESNLKSNAKKNEVKWYNKLWEKIKKIGQIIIGVIKWPIEFLVTYF